MPTARLRGSSATLSIYGIEICRSATSYADFCEQMKALEAAFLQSLADGVSPSADGQTE